LICGKVMQVSSEGLVVESGYTNLLRAPLTESWVAPGNVSASRNPNTVEVNEPGAACVGMVFLVDTPKRPPVKLYDYVMIQAYPAGEYAYTSVPTITKTIRKFSGGLETAVRLRLEAAKPKVEGVDKQSSAPQSGKGHLNMRRPLAKPYLSMPQQAGGGMPALLSQTGAFKNTRELNTSDSLIPYDLNVSFWSDGASKARWISVPYEGPDRCEKIKFSPAGEWSFPKGTVLVKHFELATDETRPEVRRRLETRLLVCDSTGSVYGVTYKWRPDNSDAELLATNLSEAIVIKTASGTRTQTWYYPSREDCKTCHTDKAGGVLGIKTRQINREFEFPSGTRENQLRSWSELGLLEPEVDEAALGNCAKLAQAHDESRSLEDRARSYLDANCAHCHRPGGTVAYFDARYDTPLASQNLIDGQILIDQGVDHARAIAPNDIWRSIIFMRANTVEGIKMPPLAHEVLDRESMSLLKQWIESMPGPPVLAPPVISPAGGSFAKSTEVTLSQSEPGVTIHYTLDGSVPTASDAVYVGPIKLTSPAVLRARAIKPGFTKSITTQAVFIVGD
jgi:uncharacterized repeat protein (TIGR03806 family)